MDSLKVLVPLINTILSNSYFKTQKSVKADTFKWALLLHNEDAEKETNHLLMTLTVRYMHCNLVE
jgi:hypothetical protein